MNRNLAQGALLAAAVLLLGGCAAGWDKSSFTLEEVFSNPDLTILQNPKEDTERLCQGVDGCLEGWTTGDGEFLRFESNESAAAFAKQLGDEGHQSNRVVIDFERAEPSAQRRELMIELIEGVHNSE